MSFRVFIVEDESDYASLLGYRLQTKNKLNARMFSTGEAALACLHEKPDLVLLDVMMPGIGGLETLRAIRQASPKTPIVVVTSQLSKQVAFLAMELGAYDYVVKGYDDMRRLPLLVDELRQRKRLLRGAQGFMQPRRQSWSLAGVLGESYAMEILFRLMRRSLRTSGNVAVLGEVGVGKTLVAHTLQRLMGAPGQPAVHIDCCAEDSATDLFGYAATETHAKLPGLLEQAYGGIVILDHVDALPLASQAHMLKLLGGDGLTDVGATNALQLRFVVTVTQDMAPLVRSGRFSERLYYHLFQFPIIIPPLRERDHDILLLAALFRKAYLRAYPEAEARRFTAEAREALLAHPWPDNVVELQNTIIRVLEASGAGKHITAHDLFPNGSAKTKTDTADSSDTLETASSPAEKVDTVTEIPATEHLLDALMTSHPESMDGAVEDLDESLGSSMDFLEEPSILKDYADTPDSTSRTSVSAPPDNPSRFRMGRSAQPMMPSSNEVAGMLHLSR